MIVCRHWLGWLLSASGTARISSWKALLFVSSSWLSTPNGLAGTVDGAQAVLDRHAEGLGSMETAAPLGHTQNRG